MTRNRYYYYDHDRCDFVELRPRRVKLYVQAVAVVVAAVVLTGVLAWGMDRTVGTPDELALRQENEALQQQLLQVQNRLEHFSEELEELSEKDRALYRTLLEAEPISDEVRQVGVGGADPYEAFGHFGTPTATLLRESSQRLDQLERQITLQNASYRELRGLATTHRDRLEQMPAIVPADGEIISGFGVRRHPVLGVNKMHEGIDILVPTGSPVVSAGKGIVREAGRSPSYGLYVEVEHRASGYRTLYAHLSQIPRHIRPGRAVARGEQIGLSGSTGRSTGPHLHYEVRDLSGTPLNPLTFVAPSMTPAQYKELLDAAQASAISLD